ncbi:MAG: ABC transporter ATP-binding protein [Candidatus Nomurabacteria bacterium]|jgi:ABC-type nitrate/sulfonate/bicarbonate transport system ATPase subunit|nr:ABC transporter ATP-binding protein [Candidatus Nomurabacteria bacterium]
MNKPIVYVESVSKSFGEQVIFRNLSFSIKQGETLAVIGHSGCGKSTLLRVIGGFEKADSGEVSVNGKIVHQPARTSIMIFQDFTQLFPWRTAISNIVWSMLAVKIVDSKSKATRIAEQYLSDMEFLPSNYNKFPIQLSGGMKQRVSVARALALKPKLLLMDEPFGALDNLTRQKMQIVTSDVCKKHNITTILVTHSVSEAIRMADNILVFCRDGKIEIIKNDKYADAKIEKLLNIRH